MTVWSPNATRKLQSVVSRTGPSAHASPNIREHRGDDREAAAEDRQAQQSPIALASVSDRGRRFVAWLTQSGDRDCHNDWRSDNREQQRSAERGIPCRDWRPLRGSDRVDEIGQREAIEEPISRWTPASRIAQPLKHRAECLPGRLRAATARVPQSVEAGARPRLLRRRVRVERSRASQAGSRDQVLHPEEPPHRPRRRHTIVGGLSLTVVQHTGVEQQLVVWVKDH